jgi:DNA-directed RNA polymerase specialized sigma24 family protein
VIGARWLGQKASDKGKYDSEEEFASVFESERVSLLSLALLLTANVEGANKCLMLALRECMACIPVSKGWILTWARRVVIRSAISLVMGSRERVFVGTNGNAEKELIVFPANDSPGTIDARQILDLPVLDRFVFVICILERYSMHDCALLLGRSPGDIRKARRRAGNQVRQVDELGYGSPHFEIRSLYPSAAEE